MAERQFQRSGRRPVWLQPHLDPDPGRQRQYRCRGAGGQWLQRQCRSVWLGQRRRFRSGLPVISPIFAPARVACPAGAPQQGEIQCLGILTN
ncbi:hypothetical protein [Pelagibacterium sp.]|uniref:hypothetical protein n=1 Tax=Pelagibacterium sp. TaxID=1967288 RepID=UPI0039C97405